MRVEWGSWYMEEESESFGGGEDWKSTQLVCALEQRQSSKCR